LCRAMWVSKSSVHLISPHITTSYHARGTCGESRVPCGRSCGERTAERSVWVGCRAPARPAPRSGGPPRRNRIRPPCRPSRPPQPHGVPTKKCATSSPTAPATPPPPKPTASALSRLPTPTTSPTAATPTAEQRHQASTPAAPRGLPLSDHLEPGPAVAVPTRRVRTCFPAGTVVCPARYLGKHSTVYACV